MSECKDDDDKAVKRRVLWEQIVHAFNEICGINCGLRKLQDSFCRITQNPTYPAYSLLYEDSTGLDMKLTS